MQIRNALPPWEFLLSASRNSLQSYELSRLGHAANLRKEVAPMLDQWVESRPLEGQRPVVIHRHPPAMHRPRIEMIQIRRQVQPAGQIG